MACSSDSIMDPYYHISIRIAYTYEYTNPIKFPRFGNLWSEMQITIVLLVAASMVTNRTSALKNNGLNAVNVPDGHTSHAETLTINFSIASMHRQRQL